MYDVAVVGGGAAGMMAAITAAREQASVLILEHMDCCGKKILATGNGRCNYTNRMQGIEYYRGDDPAFVLPALKAFGYEQTIEFFRSIGIEPREKNGCVYPKSMQAAAVRDALLLELHKYGVRIETGVGIRSIHPKADVCEICTKKGAFKSETCILATGGKSARSSGSDGSGFLYLEPLFYEITDLVPALVGLQAKQPFPGELAGIRADARAVLFVENRQIASDRGEVQLTDYGVSGIPIFQISRFAAKALARKKNVRIVLDFWPDCGEDKAWELFEKRFALFKERTVPETLNGLLHSRLAKVLTKQAGISPEKRAEKCSEKERRCLFAQIKGFSCEIERTNRFEQSQVTAGGVSTREILADTMESRRHPGLYFAGEMIDIDGMCGGYNLQWAWASGYLAGKHAAAKSRMGMR